jgi:hypothetical protein
VEPPELRSLARAYDVSYTKLVELTGFLETSTDDTDIREVAR